MTAPDWAHDDDALEAIVKDALADADTPTIPEAQKERMLRAARAAYVWRTVDEELERLSLTPETVLEESVRAPDSAQVMEFRGDNLTLELELSATSIVGQLYPTHSGGTVTFTPAAGSPVVVSSDDMGCFTISRPVRGPFRLRCDIADSSVVTDWIT